MLRQQLNEYLGEAADTGLTRSQFYLLRHLYRHGRLTVSDLAEWMNVKLPTMSPIIERLEELGLVRKEKAAKDRRVVVVSLTDEGQKVILRMEANWRRLLESRLRVLSEEDQERLISLLERFAALARTESG
jgi:DNA-binding MarR family transcriptional regulator